MIRSSAITQHAKGQSCQIRLPGICSGDASTVVFCHLNDSAFGKGMGQKATDLAGFHGCYACHAYVDTGHGTKPLMTDAELEKAMMVAVVRTWTLLVNDGVIALKVDKPKQRRIRPKSDRSPSRPIPQRQNPWPPKGATSIQSRPFSKRAKENT